MNKPSPLIVSHLNRTTTQDVIGIMCGDVAVYGGSCIEDRGGFVSNLPGDVPRVNGQLAVSRAFGDKGLKSHLSSEPDIREVIVDNQTDILVLASDGIWKVMSNDEAMEIAKRVKDPQKAAKELTGEALRRESKDDISCDTGKISL